MPLAAASDMTSIGNLGDGVTEPILEPHLNTAEIKVREAITDAKYDEVAAYENEEEGSANKKLFDRLKNAEAYMALSFAVHSLNIETQGTGIVRSKGWDQSRSELLSRNEVKDLSEHYYDTAMIFLRVFIDTDSEDNSIDTSDFSLSIL